MPYIGVKIPHGSMQVKEPMKVKGSQRWTSHTGELYAWCWSNSPTFKM